MKLILLGTGNAVTLDCFNTCYAIEENGKYFLVDGGGGIQILRHLKDASISLDQIQDIFITHKHLDHITGIFWLLRMYAARIKSSRFSGTVRIISHHEVIAILRFVLAIMLDTEPEALAPHLVLQEVRDGEKLKVLDHEITFFDIHSTKANQFGYSYAYNDTDRLTCLGDEPYNESEEEYVKNSTWLMHEAFCLYGQRDLFKPYEKHHSTVKDACETAEAFHIPNLILYHTEEKNLLQRKQLYSEEGKQYYHGNLFIPDDGDILYLK